MQGNLVELGDGLLLGPALWAGHVTVWPVFSKAAHEPVGAELVSLPEAQAAGWASVRELGPDDAGDSPGEGIEALGEGAEWRQQRSGRSAVQQQLRGRGPSVGELVIENEGRMPVIVLAGTLLKGGHQDRQVGEDFIVPAGKSVPVAAFCVEHGRWNGMRNGRMTGGRFEVQSALATKSVRSSAQFKGDQQAVWADVAAENERSGQSPGTGTLMATLEEDDAPAKARRAALHACLSGAFAAPDGADAPTPEPVGLAYAIDGRVREVRAFSHPRLFDRLRDTLLTTIALEGDLAHREAQSVGRPAPTAAADAQDVVALVQGAGDLPEQRQTTSSGNLRKMRKGKISCSAETFLDEAAMRSITRTYSAPE